MLHMPVSWVIAVMFSSCQEIRFIQEKRGGAGKTSWVGGIASWLMSKCSIISVSRPPVRVIAVGLASPASYPPDERFAMGACRRFSWHSLSAC